MRSPRTSRGRGTAKAPSTLSRRACVHPSAVAFAARGACEAPLVEPEPAAHGRRTRQQCRLIEASFALALGVERDGDDECRGVERRARGRLAEQARESRGHERLALQAQHGRAQCSLVRAASARRVEALRVAAATADTRPHLLRHGCSRGRPALPAQSLAAVKNVRRPPAFGARRPVRARLDRAHAAHLAAARVDERQRRVEESVECVRETQIKKLSE